MEKRSTLIHTLFEILERQFKKFSETEKNEVIHKGKRIRLTDFPTAILNIEVKETKTVKKLARLIL